MLRFKANHHFSKISLAAFLAIILAAMVMTSVFAHANLLRSDPADGSVLAESPRSVHLWFDEAISPKFGSAQLFDVNSQPIAIIDVRTDPSEPNMLVVDLPELDFGTYSLLWKVLSESDGHFNQGLLVFGVGEGVDLATAPVAEVNASAPPLVEVLLRWLNFILLAGAVGGFFILQLVLRPARKSSLMQLEISSVFRHAERRVLMFTIWCGGFALLGGLGFLFYQASALSDTLPPSVSYPEAIRQVLSQTRWGLIWLIRQSLFLFFCALVFLIYRKLHTEYAPLNTTSFISKEGNHKSNAIRFRVLWISANLVSFSLIFAQSISGHSSGLSANPALAVFADTLHLFAACLWVGGLLSLAVGLLPLVDQRATGFATLLRAGWRPFSRVAAISVGLLAATGLYSAGRQVASLDALLTSLYGQTLLAKIILMLNVGAIGLLNSILLHPRLAAPFARLFRRLEGWTPLAFHRLPTLIAIEGSLGILVLLLTGLVTASPAPRGYEFTVAPDQVPGSLTQSVDDMVVTLNAKPNKPGQNVLTVFSSSIRRPPPAAIARVILRFTYLEQDLGRVSTTLEEVEPGRFMLGGNHLSLAGTWQIDVVVRRLGMQDSVASFTWVVAPVGEARPELVSKRPWEPILSLGAALVLLIMLLIITVLWIGRGKPIDRTSSRSGPNIIPLET